MAKFVSKNGHFLLFTFNLAQVQAEEVQAEENAEVIQAEEVQEAVQEFTEDSMPEDEKQEHPHVPVEPCLEAVTESIEPVESDAQIPEKTPEIEKVLIAECSPTKNEDPEAVADDRKTIIRYFDDLSFSDETTEEIFKKAAEAGLAVRQ